MAALSVRVTASAAVIGFALLASAARAQQTPPPQFQSGVEVVPIDVTVVDDRGRPVPGLTPTDFTVRIDGQPRRVINAELISESTAGRGAASPPSPEGYASNERAGGRLILLVVDQHNIMFTELRPLQDAVYRFIDGLSPSDRTALIGFGAGAPSVPFTADRDRLKRALTKMPGQASADGTTRPFPMSTSTAIAIDGGDRRALAAVMSQNCAVERLPTDVCEFQIRARATMLVLSARLDGDGTGVVVQTSPRRRDRPQRR
jgi:VWFA-related protein